MSGKKQQTAAGLFFSMLLRAAAREDGVGKELVQYFANASYEVGTVTSNVTESTDGYDVVIIIGASDSNH